MNVEVPFTSFEIRCSIFVIHLGTNLQIDFMKFETPQYLDWVASNSKTNTQQ
jgi:hypothetical protein